MRETLAAVLVILFVMAMFAPERFGAVSHDTFNRLVAGWESVR